ncbi:hypothetical protein C499_12150 [Halogeometricum borinquense DSM 11551]|uniref:Uncharacterized protein n=1 Tax=Halogeometricum borinquense (strain ATCC 700274 / DSM 11551 / JCM 10706 / KCTC 4070 / PR3) TaxID=469382 RepID=E4NW98_HALBP|nr:hypothetical protein [Halogeometricum borinquense]ADQ69318.1 hypothetical protein Hbor_36120 [Halogeometricum borinquense DSM 11551]ELY26209.1 hypothetical protein C499_12150 [Halogeometricum borinquense DSM 11551]
MQGYDRGRLPQRGDEDSYKNGTMEVIFTTGDSHVRTLREYPPTDSLSPPTPAIDALSTATPAIDSLSLTTPANDAFDESVSTATSRGVNTDVASLPDASAFSTPDGMTGE